MRISLTIVLCVLITAAQAQFKWAADGRSYYGVEKGSIVRYQLPSRSGTPFIDSSLLVPKGTNKALPVRDFSFSDDGNKMLIYTNSKRVWRYDTRGDYYVLDQTTKQLRKLGAKLPESSLMFAKFAPDGKSVAYESKHNLYVEDLKTGMVKQLTKDGTDRIINGTFDWAYEEEFGMTDGFRWSPDSKSIAYWQIDARKIKNFLLINNTDSIYSFVTPVEYPKVGEDPSSARIGVVSVATGITKWMPIPGDPVQHYLTEMEWAGNGQLIIQQLNRKQNQSILMLANTASGSVKPIYSETDKAWIDTRRRFTDAELTGWHWINKGTEFLWISEKDGWRHVYRIGLDGKEQLITKGDYDIISLKAIDEANGYVYFYASPQNATQRYLYRAKMDGSGSLEPISPLEQKGTHNYRISPGALFAEHSFSNANTPPTSEWVSLPDHSIVSRTGGAAPNARRNNVEFFQVTTDDGVTMDGFMIKPVPFDSTKKYPVVFLVYAEPASQTVRDQFGAQRSWYGGDMARDGYVFISVDNRGTPAPKGAAWRKSIYQKIGILNVDDQAKAARKILQWKFIDTSRVAVFGHSGGGSTTLNLMFRYPDIYKTGVALSPVAWRLSYDNIYEERYMGLPQENRQAYIDASAITHAKGLRGNLLVIHGTGDDNVHYQNTELLINELVKQGKQFSLMSYPNRTHGLSEGAGTTQHLYTLVANYLKANCPPGGR